jgi:hypothetical protein
MLHYYRGLSVFLLFLVHILARLDRRSDCEGRVFCGRFAVSVPYRW